MIISLFLIADFGRFYGNEWSVNDYGQCKNDSGDKQGPAVVATQETNK